MKDLLQKTSLKKVTNALKDQDCVLGILLYGSFARGDFGPRSDIDIFIIISNKIYLNKTNDILASLETKRPLQPVIRALSELEKSDNILLQKIFQEGKLIYWNSLIDLPAYTILKIKPYTIFTFELIKHTQNTKNKFNYLLYGKKLDGLIYKLGGKKLSSSCVQVPFDKHKDILKVFNKFNIKHNSSDIWE